MNQQKRSGLVFFGTITLLILGLFAVPFMRLNQSPVSERALARLEPGIDKAKVLTILGSPAEEGLEVWTYSKKGAWPIVYVHFDSEGHFKSHEHDY